MHGHSHFRHWQLYTALHADLLCNAIYDFRNAKKLVIRNQIANQKVIDAKLLNLRTQEFEDVCLQTAPKINGFPQQETNLNQMLIILKPYLTE